MNNVGRRDPVSTFVSLYEESIHLFTSDIGSLGRTCETDAPFLTFADAREWRRSLRSPSVKRRPTEIIGLSSRQLAPRLRTP